MGPGAHHHRAEGPLAVLRAGGKVGDMRLEMSGIDDLGDGPTSDGTPALSADADVFEERGRPAPKRGRSRGVVIGLVVFGLALAMVWVALEARSGGSLGQDPFGRAAPAFDLPVLGDGGKSLALSDLRGKPIVLNFWASWCGPCKAEAPVLAAAEGKWRSKGVVFLGVDAGDTEEDALAFEKRYGIGYDSVVDPQESLAAKYGVFGYPETFFIDGDGVIRAKQVGGLDAQTLDTYVASLVD
jgi:cytochrome c biogenesis protein CcmG, thiol:disulfide interchange protein DsbE